jgi:preprotein translocase subunit SecG
MQQVLLIVLLVVALALIGVILLQQGKGAGMGASFGAGASGTVFGAPGSANVLTRITAVLAIIFFSVALALGYLAEDGNVVKDKDIFDKAAEEVVAPVESDIPAESTEASQQAESDIPVEDKPAVVEPEAKSQAKDAKDKGDKDGDNGGQ